MSQVVGFFIYDEFQTVDLAGPLDAFATVNELLAPREAYKLITLSADVIPVRSESGLKTLADDTIARCDVLDMLVIIGGRGCQKVIHNQSVMAHLQRVAANSKRVVSICTGAFIVAALFPERTLTLSTHWNFTEQLATQFPHVTVESEKLFVQSEEVYSSGGLTAGIDLSLSIIAQDHGAAMAQQVAQYMVMYVRRSGDQRQYSSLLSAQQTLSQRFQGAIDFIQDNIDKPLSVELLAEQASLSPRHFRRIFTDKMGLSPMRFVQHVRLEKAKNLLCTTNLSIAQISVMTGFGSPPLLSRKFTQAYSVNPTQFRENFTLEAK
ncbi:MULTISPECIES: GlxA family transcriptional regulator [Pseudoalteromonas]|uniref:GlxA family transcriptional regulator n=1 Tax=Pseudoalteromonas obscura TaxID=3048491 RepID=A0ABT7ESX8_9GAMM|nr:MULTISPECIES: GlxA family transcriptional regulator [Pseudoalteromonas]MBQ4839320.1 GlxA family transcriptional regulator [Pseudoalteromonas luteoviolacea]MDK2598161.1 GlxA family transcriptional regulator [Pseudoalteromonas sp. P94(2023)]